MTREEVTAPAILHVDMDAFYVSVELLRRPDLRGQPVAVGGLGNRGVIAAASYEARVFGVYSAMPTVRAKRLCPHLVLLAGDHGLYSEVSGRVMAIFQSYTPLVEPISLDEAFLDVRGALRSIGDGPTIAAMIRDEVRDKEQLTCSVGVATSKFLAKLASEAAKPRVRGREVEAGAGVRVVDAGAELAFLQPLPARALWGVGPKTLERLERLGVHTVGDIAALPVESLTGALGDVVGRHLHNLSWAIDERPVTPDQRPKSISFEETFPRDIHDAVVLGREVVRMSDAVASRLRHAELAGRTVTLKIRFGDFRTITRSTTLPSAVDDGPAIARAGAVLLAEVDCSVGVRLLGVAVTALTGGAARQLSFEDVDAPSWQDASGAIDRIRDRFGDEAIGPAASLGRDGLRMKRRGNAAWGPSD